MNLTETGDSKRPFARPQRRFHTIAGSTFPACPFASALKIPRDPLDPELLRSLRFRSRIRGEFHVRYPLSHADLRRSLDFIRSPLPFGLFGPSGSKRSTELLSGKSAATKHPIALCSPPRSPCGFRLGSRHQDFALSRSAHRSVNPGTESIMNCTQPRGQMKNRAGPGLSSAL